MTNEQKLWAVQLALAQQNVTAGLPYAPSITNIEATSYLPPCIEAEDMEVNPIDTSINVSASAVTRHISEVIEANEDIDLDWIPPVVSGGQVTKED